MGGPRVPNRKKGSFICRSLPQLALECRLWCPLNKGSAKEDRLHLPTLRMKLFLGTSLKTLKKGHVAWRNKQSNYKEQAAGADFTGLAGKPSTKCGEDVTQGPLKTLSARNENRSLTKVLAMDCEMVGAGSDGKRSILARVSLVNMSGNVVYDKHVRPREQVTDYRTKISGVRASNLRKGEDFAVVQKEVGELILGRVLVGHSLRNDFKTLFLSHPKKDTRDTALYPPLHNTNGRPRALRHIAEELLGVKIQVEEHCSVQDARAAMYIYQHLKRDWEGTMPKKH